MVDYEINEETLAIIPIDEKNSMVYELNNTFEINKSANKIMEDSCQYFGSSLKGRQKGTYNLIGVTHKVPIIIEETKEIIFFPTHSNRLVKCNWISLKNIINYYKEDEKMVVEFKNNQKIKFNISYGILDNQILRATRLESVLRQRKNK